MAIKPMDYDEFEKMFPDFCADYISNIEDDQGIDTREAKQDIEAFKNARFGYDEDRKEGYIKIFYQDTVWVVFFEEPIGEFTGEWEIPLEEFEKAWAGEAVSVEAKPITGWDK